MTRLLDDEDYDSKYIAIEGSSCTKIYEAFRLIAEFKGQVGISTGIDPRKISLDMYFCEDLDMEKEEMEDFADDVAKRFLPPFRTIQDIEVHRWLTLYDAMVSVIKNLDYVGVLKVPNGIKKRGQNRQQKEKGEFLLQHDNLDMKEEYVSFDDGRRKNYKTRVYHVPRIVRDIKSIISEMTATPIDEISLEVNYGNDLQFGDDDLVYVRHKCMRLLDRNEIIPIHAIKKWITIHDTVDSVVRARHDRKRFEVPAKVRY